MHSCLSLSFARLPVYLLYLPRLLRFLLRFGLLLHHALDPERPADHEAQPVRCDERGASVQEIHEGFGPCCQSCQRFALDDGRCAHSPNCLFAQQLPAHHSLDVRSCMRLDCVPVRGVSFESLPKVVRNSPDSADHAEDAQVRSRGFGGPDIKHRTEAEEVCRCHGQLSVVVAVGGGVHIVLHIKVRVSGRLEEGCTVFGAVGGAAVAFGGAARGVAETDRVSGQLRGVKNGASCCVRRWCKALVSNEGSQIRAMILFSARWKVMRMFWQRGLWPSIRGERSSRLGK